MKSDYFFSEKGENWKRTCMRLTLFQALAFKEEISKNSVTLPLFVFKVCLKKTWIKIRKILI
jgi:hypothetical protein